MLPAPGNAPTTAPERELRGDEACGELGLGGSGGLLAPCPNRGGPSLVPITPRGVRLSLCLHPPHAAPLPHCLGCQRGCGWPGAPRRGSHGCTPCPGAAPSIPPPCANTGQAQVGGTEDALLPPRGEKEESGCSQGATSMGWSRKDPHPLQTTASPSLLSAEGPRSSREGSGCP